jgi:two-component system, response regulator
MRDILLAEGNAEDAAVALESFKANGLLNPVRFAGDGREVLDFLFSWRALSRSPTDQPALILLDLHLPIIDSRDLLQLIKADPHTQRIPTIVLTSGVFDRKARDALGHCRTPALPDEHGQCDEQTILLESVFQI